MQEARTDLQEKLSTPGCTLRAVDLEKRRAYDRDWYARNRDRLAAKRAVRTPEQVERERARKRDYYRRNRDKLDAKAKEYREAHQEAQRARSRAYYWANRERILAEGKAFRAAARARKMERLTKTREEAQRSLQQIILPD